MNTTMTKDPLGIRGGDVNLYRYVGNNPILHNDPTGEIVPALLLTYAAYEAGFFIGATYNKVSADINYSSTYSEASPLLNVTEQILPTSTLFSSTDTYNVIDNVINGDRTQEIDAQIEAGGSCNE